MKFRFVSFILTEFPPANYFQGVFINPAFVEPFGLTLIEVNYKFIHSFIYKLFCLIQMNVFFIMMKYFSTRSNLNLLKFNENM